MAEKRTSCVTLHVCEGGLSNFFCAPTGLQNKQKQVFFGDVILIDIQENYGQCRHVIVVNR